MRLYATGSIVSAPSTRQHDRRLLNIAGVGRACVPSALRSGMRADSAAFVQLARATWQVPEDSPMKKQNRSRKMFGVGLQYQYWYHTVQSPYQLVAFAPWMGGMEK